MMNRRGEIETFLDEYTRNDAFEIMGDRKRKLRGVKKCKVTIEFEDLPTTTVR